MIEFLKRGWQDFAKHVLLLVLGASAPLLTSIAGSGVEHLSHADLWSWFDAEQAALALAAVAWLTPITSAYGVGAAKLEAATDAGAAQVAAVAVAQDGHDPHSAL